MGPLERRPRSLTCAVLPLVLALGLAAACGSDSVKRVAANSSGSASGPGSTTTTVVVTTSTETASASSSTAPTYVAPTNPSSTTSTTEPQPVVVLDVSGAGKMTTAAFSADGEWEIRADVDNGGDISITIYGPSGLQIDSLHYRSSGVSMRHEACQGCTLQIESFDPNVVHDPNLPPPGFHVVVTDLPG